MKVREGTRTAEIIALFRSGMRQADIAREVSCTPANVYRALFNHGEIDGPTISMRISPLTLEDRTWLRKQAAIAKVPLCDLARAMLVDAINEARDAKT